MKILVIQLARLGDIFMTWPALRAVRRQYPKAEIHVLTRPKFSAAFSGLNVIDKVIQLPSKEILAPLVQLNLDVKGSFDLMSDFADGLQAEKYDWILNYSFSPFSSYLTHAISHEQTRVCGYTRTSDGFLGIPDDMSAYFYAQVGVGRSNRFHLIDIFASQAGVDLVESDWNGPTPMPVTDRELPEDYIVVHIGASENIKALSAPKWIEILGQVQKTHPIHVVLIGAVSEEAIANEICDAHSDKKFINLVGQTQLSELFPIIKRASLLVGCDSAPIHMATLVKTPAVNISLSTVNFWETGPRSTGSVVVRAKDEKELLSDKVAVAIHRNLIGERPELGVYPVQPGAPSYWVLNSKQAEFNWQFLKALYMNEEFPGADNPQFLDGMEKLSETNRIIIDMMEKVQLGSDLKAAVPIIEAGEEVIETVAKLVPALIPLIRWYQTEKIRITPAEQKVVLQKTLDIHVLLQKVLNLYTVIQEPVEEVLR